MSSHVALIVTGLLFLSLGFIAGVLLVLYCRRRPKPFDKSGTSISKRMSDRSGTRKSNTRDEESQLQEVDNVLDGVLSKDVAIFEINIDYNEFMVNVVHHSPHEVRMEEYKIDEGGYVPAIVTYAEKPENEEEREDFLPYNTKLVFCTGEKEPQYHIHISDAETTAEESAQPILGLCVHRKSLKVYELRKKQKKQHHMLMQRSRSGNEPFTTIFVGCAKGVVNVKHNQTGVFRLLIWWNMANK